MYHLPSRIRAKAVPLASLFILFATVTHSVRAQQTPPVQLEPIVVSASRIPTPLPDTPESVTVINREQIEAQHPLNTIDLLRQVVGLHIDQPGGPGSVSSAYIRGSDPNFTTVLIDGIKVNDPTNTRGGSFDFSTLDPASIERVEIVRGPLSSVYGSDAMGGVINIVTRQGTATPRLSVIGSGGGHGYHRAGFAAGGPIGPAHAALNFSYIDHGTPVNGSALTSKNVSTKISLPPTTATWLQFSLRYMDSHGTSFPDDSGGPQFAVLRQVDKRDIQELTAGAEFSHELLPGWEYSLKASVYDRHEEVTSPGVAPGVRDPFGIPPNRNDSHFRRTNVLLSSLFSPFSALRATGGLDIQLEEGDSESVLVFEGFSVPGQFDLDRTIYSPFLEAEYDSPWGLTLHAGLRVDAADDFAAEVSPRFGVLYRLAATHTTLKANWGEGFKLPSFFALANPIVGNPQLGPETSEGFDVGIVQDVWDKRISLSTTFFHNQFWNLIDFDPGPPPQLVNRSKVTTHGVELSVNIQAFEHVWLHPHLTYTATNITGTAEDLRNRPDWRSGLIVRWSPLAALVLNLNVLYVGDVRDSSIPTGERRLDDYVRFDIAATWMPFAHCQLSFAIDNLFDANYQEAVGFPAPGLLPRVTARLTF